MIPFLVKWTKWTILIPLQVIGVGCLFILDQLLPRYLLAAVLVAPLAALGYFGVGLSLLPFLIASLVLGAALAGLWENSEAFSGRALLGLLAKQHASPRGRYLSEPGRVGIAVERVTTVWVPHRPPPEFPSTKMGERHAQRAVAYGLTLQRLTQWRLAPPLFFENECDAYLYSAILRRRDEEPGFNVRVAVATGCMVLDGGRLLNQADWDWEHKPILRALAAAAKPGEAVCVSSDTWFLIKDEFEAQDPAGRLVPGPDGEMRVWDVVGWKKELSGQPFSSPGAPPRRRPG